MLCAEHRYDRRGGTLYLHMNLWFWPLQVPMFLVLPVFGHRFVVVCYCSPSKLASLGRWTCDRDVGKPWSFMGLAASNSSKLCMLVSRR